MYNKKVLRDAVNNLNRTVAPGKKKDMIVDPMGQWKYPGQNTRIPGNDITMQGVPYPVWAVPNVGTPQMMYPQQDYYFPGADHVDEYPQIAQTGGVKPYVTSDINDYKFRKELYKDSLALYNYNKLQRQLEKHSDLMPVGLQLVTLGYSGHITNEGKRKQKILQSEVDKILKSNPNLKLGTYQKSSKPGTYNNYVKYGSWDIHHPNIAPKGHWLGLAYNEDYSHVKPVQPVVFKKPDNTSTKIEVDKDVKNNRISISKKPVQPIIYQKEPLASLSFVPPTITDLEFAPPIEPEVQWTNPNPWNDVEQRQQEPKIYAPEFTNTKRYDSRIGKWVEQPDVVKGSTEDIYNKVRWEWAQKNRQQPSQLNLTGQTFAYGGDISIPDLNQYEDGGEYDLTQEEIDDLIAQGYEIEDVDTDELKKGGTLKLPNKKNSRLYSRSLTARNKLFLPNNLTASKKWRIFDPQAKYLQEGGISPLEGNYISNVIMNRNRGTDFVDRAYALGANPGTPLFNVPDDEQFGSWMSHKMAYGEGEGGKAWMFPTVLNPKNEAIEVPGQYADYISSEGYKYATGMKQEGGPADTIVYPPGDSEYMNQPPLNFDIIEKEDYEYRKGYNDYLDFLRNEPKKKTLEYYTDEPLRLAEKGGFQDDINRRRKLLRDWTYGASIGMLHKAQLGLIKSPYKLPAGTKHPMQVSSKPSKKVSTRTYNALEDIRPQVSESTKPVATFKPNVNLKDAVQTKKDELDSAAYLVSQDPLLSEKQKADIMMDRKKLEDNIYRIYTENPSEIKQVAPQSKSSRIWEYITNPLTALEYEISGGGAENMPRNINRMRMAEIDPGVVQGRNLVGNTLNEFYNLADAADKTARYTAQGDYSKAGLEALRFLPGARISTGLGKTIAKKSKAIGKTLESPVLSNPYVRAGAGSMDVSNHIIKNPDYYTQLLKTYNYNALPAGNRKFYKDLIATVKKQDGLVTQRQLNELKRLETGNFDFGSKGYNKSYAEGGEAEYEDLDLTPEEIDWYLANGYEIEDLGEVE